MRAFLRAALVKDFANSIPQILMILTWALHNRAVSIRCRPQGRWTTDASALVGRLQLPVDFNQLDEVFDSEVGECRHAVVAEAVDPDHPILWVHFIGDVIEPVHAFAEALGGLSS